jgi:lysophospholipase L1-like esterase
MLAVPPLVWLGLRSYSFYLWHWPVLALTRPGIDVSMPRAVLIPLQLLAVLALAELSYRFVERPFRKRPEQGPSPNWSRYARPALLVGVPATVLLVGWSGIVSGGDRLSPSAAASTAEFAKVQVRPAADGSSGKGAGGTGARRNLPPRIVAFGDSVMIGAKERLAARLGRRFSMNARVGRQADEFVELVRRLKASGGRIDALIVQMGSNGPLYSAEMEALREATSDVGVLVLINDHAPVSWIEESNDQLAEAAETWPHTELIDWAAVAKEHDKLTWDETHLTPAGAGVYTRMVTRAVRRVTGWRSRQ